MVRLLGIRKVHQSASTGVKVPISVLSDGVSNHVSGLFGHMERLNLRDVQLRGAEDGTIRKVNKPICGAGIAPNLYPLITVRRSPGHGRLHGGLGDEAEVGGQHQFLAILTNQGEDHEAPSQILERDSELPLRACEGIGVDGRNSHGYSLSLGKRKGTRRSP